MDLDTPRFTTDQIAKAAGVSPETLGSQVRRGDLPLAPSESPELRQPGQGRTRYWSARRALSYALTVELARRGLSVREASQLALKFTDAGGEGDEPRIVGAAVATAPPENMRRPGDLFREGKTVFRVVLVPGRGPIGAVERWEDVKDAPEVMRPGLVGTSAVIVPLNELVERVFAALGVVR